eukprot:8003068-Heterocapsa_arctica.AAC.1
MGLPFQAPLAIVHGHTKVFVNDPALLPYVLAALSVSTAAAPPSSASMDRVSAMNADFLEHCDPSMDRDSAMHDDIKARARLPHLPAPPAPLHPYPTMALAMKAVAMKAAKAGKAKRVSKIGKGRLAKSM